MVWLLAIITLLLAIIAVALMFGPVTAQAFAGFALVGAGLCIWLYLFGGVILAFLILAIVSLWNLVATCWTEILGIAAIVAFFTILYRMGRAPARDVPAVTWRDLGKMAHALPMLLGKMALALLIIFAPFGLMALLVWIWPA